MKKLVMNKRKESVKKSSQQDTSEGNIEKA
jgi:hypothetical protein